MKIEQRTIVSQPMRTVISAILQEVEENTNYLRCALPRGWHFILKTKGSGIENLCLDVTADVGGGSFAKAKMETLEKCPNLPATGKTPKELIPIVEKLDSIEEKDREEILKRLGANKYADSLSKDAETFLRDHAGITGYKGGVRLPYSVILSDRNLPEHGEILISFSGASAEQDLFFGLSIAKQFIRSYRESFKQNSLFLKLDDLETNHPAEMFWLKLLGIK